MRVDHGRRTGTFQDLTVVVLAQRAADDTGMPAVGDKVLAATLLAQIGLGRAPSAP